MIRNSLCGCIFLGTGCLAGFFLLGPALGRLLFHSSLAGEFIRTLSWMCPFLYANSALISIIHGLGKTGISFLLNTLSLFIRIIGVLYFTAYWGIPGYLHCLLASQILGYLLGGKSVGILFLDTGNHAHFVFQIQPAQKFFPAGRVGGKDYMIRSIYHRLYINLITNRKPCCRSTIFPES